MFDWIQDTIDENSTEEYNVNNQELVSAFESLLNSDGIIFESTKEEMIEKFDEIVSRYDEISSEIGNAHEEIGEGEKVTLLGEIEELPEWQEENQPLVAEIESLWNQFQQLMEKVDRNESKFEEDESLAKLNSFADNLSDDKNLTLERD